jgi:hypothetical protein
LNKEKRTVENSIRNKIKECVRSGYTIEATQKKCGHPSRALVRKVMQEIDPHMYSLLGDTKAYDKYREELFQKSIKS